MRLTNPHSTAVSLDELSPRVTAADLIAAIGRKRAELDALRVRRAAAYVRVVEACERMLGGAA